MDLIQHRHLLSSIASQLRQIVPQEIFEVIPNSAYFGQVDNFKSAPRVGDPQFSKEFSITNYFFKSSLPDLDLHSLENALRNVPNDGHDWMPDQIHVDHI